MLCCSNKDKSTYKFLRPRKEEESACPWEIYKLDLHTPPILREKDKIMTAGYAAEAAKIYLGLMCQLYGVCCLLPRACLLGLPAINNHSLEHNVSNGCIFQVVALLTTSCCFAWAWICVAFVIMRLLLCRPIPTRSWLDPCDREGHQDWLQDLPGRWQAAGQLDGHCCVQVCGPPELRGVHCVARPPTYGERLLLLFTAYAPAFGH